MNADDLESRARRVVDYAAGDVAAPFCSYPRPLPPALEPWYVYVVDSGHCLLCLPRELRPPGADLTLLDAGTELAGLMVPAPVKAVLEAGYEVQGGVIVVDLPYDPTLGLMTPEESDEF